MALESDGVWNFTSSKPTEPTARQGNFHVKLWISSLIKLPKHPHLENTAVFANQLITYVEVFGTVVDRVALGKADIYMVDDGTGVVSIHVKKNEVQLENISSLSSQLQNDSSFMVMSKGQEDGIASLLNLLYEDTATFKVGDSIQCKGGDSTLQLEATYCVANIALWEDEMKKTSPTARIFGTYLITLLGSGNPLIQEGCCWALSNMLPQGKVILAAQGVGKKVCELLSSPSKNVTSSATQFLVQLISTNSVSSGETVQIAKGAVSLLKAQDQDPSLNWLFFLLSYQQHLDEFLVSNSLHILLLQNVKKEVNGSRSVVALVPLIRCLTNLCSLDTCLRDVLTEKNLVYLLAQLLKFPYDQIRKETFVLMATILNNKNSEICGMVERAKLREMLEEPLSIVSCLL